MKKNIAAAYGIAAFLPISVGFAVSVYLWAVAPDTWEGFGWNPGVLKAIMVFFASLMMSLGCVVGLIVVRLVGRPWRHGGDSSKIWAILFIASISAGILVAVEHLQMSALHVPGRSLNTARMIRLLAGSFLFPLGSVIIILMPLGIIKLWQQGSPVNRISAIVLDGLLFVACLIVVDHFQSC